MINLRLVFAWLFLACCHSMLGHTLQDVGEKKEKIVLYYKFDKVVLEVDYLTNQSSMNQLHELLEDNEFMNRVDSIAISSYSSPEGPLAYNEQLALKRAEALATYVYEQMKGRYDIPIKLFPLGENWEGLREMVEADSTTPFKEEVLRIIDSNYSFTRKESLLKALAQGQPWRYIQKNFLPYLRGASCMVFYLDPVKVVVEEPVVPELPPVVVEEPILETPSEPIVELEPRMIRPLAVKTNLLFDLATLLNVELEVPIGRRFSVAGEWIFPWWLFEDDQNCLEVLSGNLEARYWFKPNYSKQDPLLKKHNPLTGWFVGIYGGGGLYDLEWKREGYQGEFFIASGLSAGYVKPLHRNLNLEFSLGVGVLRTKYRHYHAEYCDIDSRWHLIKQHNGTYTWVGPTKAKISLVWYPHFKLNKRGGKL